VFEAGFHRLAFLFGLASVAVWTYVFNVLPLRITGVLDEPTGGSPFGEVAVSSVTFDRAFPNHDNEFTFVNMRGGVSETNTAALERSVRRFPEANVETRDQFRDRQLSMLDTALNIVYALLALSVIVSQLGSSIRSC
jgi:putative ABC transport system permease protein